MKQTMISALFLTLLLAPAPGRATQAPAAPEAAKSPEDAAAEARFDRALEQLAAGELEAAIATLEPFRNDPRTPPPALGLLGALYMEVDRPEDALAVLEPLAAAESADPGALYNAGRAALALGREEVAVGYLERSVALEAGTPAARELGLLLGRRGDLVASFQLLVPWAQAHPDDRQARLAAAHAALVLERVPAAEGLLSDLPQDDAAVRLLWGRLLSLKGDPHGALATLRPLLAGDVPPEMELDVRRTMAEAHLLLGDSAAAVELLQGLAGDDPAVALQLSRAQYQGGDLEAALATLAPFEQAAQSGSSTLPPNLRGALAADYGRLLMTASRFEEALPYLRIATELLPRDKQAWQSLGQTLAALGQTEAGEEALRRFDELARAELPSSVRAEELERGVDDPTGRQVREAMRLLGDNRGAEALALLRQEIALAPDDIRPRLIESRALLALGRNQDALESAERALEIAPESADAYYQRGAARIAVDRLDEAEADLRRALEISPNHLAALGDLGVLLMVEGRRDEAREMFQRILEIRPDDPLAARHLETLAQSSGS